MWSPKLCQISVIPYKIKNYKCCTQIELRCFGFMLLAADQSDAPEPYSGLQIEIQFSEMLFKLFILSAVCVPCTYFLGLASAQFLIQAWK